MMLVILQPLPIKRYASPFPAFEEGRVATLQGMKGEEVIVIRCIFLYNSHLISAYAIVHTSVSYLIYVSICFFTLGCIYNLLQVLPKSVECVMTYMMVEYTELPLTIDMQMNSSALEKGGIQKAFLLIINGAMC